MQISTEKPCRWAFLDAFRGKDFTGEWPTMSEMFSITVKRFGSRPCFTDFDPDKRSYTYNQVFEMVGILAQWLISMGIKKGDCVAVTGKNSPEWGTVYLAAGFAGAIIVPIDYGLHDAEIVNLMNTAKPKIFFVDEEKYDFFSKNPNGAKIYSLSKKHQEVYVFNLKPDKEYPFNMPTETDICAILFTSGTTGIPKGVVLSHRNFVSDCYIAQTNLYHDENDVFYALLPLHHAYTMQAAFINPLSEGCEIVFGKSMAVTRLLKDLREGKITLMLGVPLLYNKLLAGILKGIREKGIIVYGVMRFLMWISYAIKKIFKVNPGKKMFHAILEKASISTIRVAISGGGPLAPSVYRMYQELGIDFIQGYGLTETSPIVTLTPIDKFKLDSVGRDFSPYMEMTILNPDEDGVGEVAFKGPMVMQGYFNMPNETKEMFTEDGWLKTGDLGRMDSEHYLYLCGRAKNLIVTAGGKNVYPEELENAFQLFTDIEQITIQGFVLDATTKSEGIEALVYPSDDLYKRLNLKRGTSEAEPLVSSTVDEIIEKVNKTLPPYARIMQKQILESPLEMTTTRKVKRIYNK